MSLKSSRGRFTVDEFNNMRNMKSSLISGLGCNPNSLFKSEESNDINIYASSSNLEELKNKRKVLFERRNNFNDKYSDNRGKKKSKLFLYISMFVVELFTLIGIYFLGTFIRYTNMTQKVTFDKAAVTNKDIDEATLEVMKGYKTVAIFGVDSRTGSLDKGNNSDVNIIANLNLETGEAQLVSVYRDLYLSVTQDNLYDKMNSSYRRGGPEAAVKALNRNFDLNITNFFSFNWKAVADGIELLGGIEVPITNSEFRYMNAFIHETCKATGVDANNPSAHYLKCSGVQHLDGIQAVGYGRLRLMDSDFQRTERQKKVISLCLEKAKKLDIAQLKIIMEAILPQIAYEFDTNEMLSLLKIIKSVHIVSSTGCPEAGNVTNQIMGSCGDCLVPISLEKAVVKLHETLYGAENYKISSSARNISNRIAELKRKHAEENKLKAESIANEGNETTLNKVVASKSTANKSKKKQVASKSTVKKVNPNNDIEKEDIVPVLDDEYEEELENDNIENEISESNNNQNNESEALSNDLRGNNTQVEQNRIAPQTYPGDENVQSRQETNQMPQVTQVSPGSQMSPAGQMSPVGQMSPGSQMSPVSQMTPGNQMTPNIQVSPGVNTSGGLSSPVQYSAPH